ncbi:hypothetical protein GWI33_020695 [Rhynchophorus ferrugineus]|uniref:Uncharacterized protein n=1 Tax=Rhynchophorus ferrugineus TaxID=354439 RepID=A0A834HU05_RHYFE|nr:hypothetical protein GWI33_020695 [Rhynchophorus ferrugineus]
MLSEPTQYSPASRTIFLRHYNAINSNPGQLLTTDMLLPFPSISIVNPYRLRNYTDAHPLEGVTRPRGSNRVRCENKQPPPSAAPAHKFGSSPRSPNKNKPPASDIYLIKRPNERGTFYGSVF